MARWLLLAVLATLLLAPSASAASFEGTTWRVTRIAGQPVAEFQLSLEFPSAQEFAGKRLELRRAGRTLVVLKRR